MTISPLLSVRTEDFLNHCQEIIKLDGAKIMWGGKAL